MTPWYRDFRNIYLEYAGATEHESFGHPVACVIAVSSLHPDPIEAMSRLYDSQKVALFDKGFVDHNVLKYYVLVHDCQLGDFSKSLALFERMRKQLGAQCHLLKLGAALNDELAPDIWAPYRSRQWLIENAPAGDWHAMARHPAESMIVPLDTMTAIDDGRRASSRSELGSSTIAASVLSGGGGGSSSSRSIHERPALRNVDSLEELQPAPLIAAADVDSVRLMVRELVVQSLIPYMERSIQYWNEQVASGRRGVAGRIFSAGRRLFGHQAKTSSLGQIPPTHRGSSGELMGQDLATVYNYSSPEMQLRRQADFSFMLGDYRSALSVYDTLKRDFSTEKAWKHMASAQEMMGMCELILGNGDRFDAEYNLEQVVNLFVQRARNGECATRAAILHYELFRYANMYYEAAHALLKSTDESSNLRCALFLEQAAHSFSRAMPPKVRKYAFSLVLAGHRYSKEELRDRAFHCYKLASAVFDTKAWRNVENHIHFALGRQAFHRDMLTTALEHFIRLFHESEQSTAVQTSYLREFLYICQSYTTRYNKDPLVEAALTLPIPVIDDQQVTVTLPNCQVRREESDDDAWQAMEAAFSTEASPTMMPLGDQRRPTCAVGESVVVHLEMYNPMRVMLKLSNIALECVHEENTDTDGTTASQYNAHELRKPTDDPNSISSMITLEYFQLENIWEANLQPRERKKMTLKLIPKREGVIQIIGLRYTLDEVVHGYKKFGKRGRRLNSTKAERTQQLYAPDTSLNLLVTPPMPLLDITVKHFPANMLSGEVVQATLIITNGGERDLKHLRVASSHPTMLYIGSAGLVDTPAYREQREASRAEVEGQAHIEWQTMDNGLAETRYTEIPFGTANGDGEEEQWLRPGASVTLPLWVRADRIGRHTLRLLFHYQSEESKYKMRSRTSRYTLETQVLPSLRVNAFTRASTQNLNEYILGLEAESLQASADLVITQLSLTSAKWRIEPITPKAAEQISPLRLSSRQALYAYYRIRRLALGEKESETLSPERYTQACL
ncbi:ER-golgi trafficking TRAPP I complex 85 kDa subunit-domain-containing protein, partial [Syncephalis pseudoplumigaleata]